MGTRSEITPTDAFYRIDINTLPPDIAADGWHLEIDGLVDQPAAMTLQDLQEWPAVSQYITLSCISNPIGGDLISTALWTGVRLKDLLEQIGLQADARALRIEAQDGFYETVVMDDLMDERTLLVYAMNGEPLPAEHGFPARLLTPGLYGFVGATKWLVRMQATSYAEGAYWTKRGWATDAPILTQSRIDTPRGLSTIAAGQVAKNVDEEALGHVFDQAFDGYDKGTDVVATALLLAGARLDLVASPPTTHFRHESGDTSKDVWFVAQATFDGPLAQQRLDCWALAGIEVPPDGPLNGYRVRWEIFNGLPVLQAKKSDTDKVLHGSLTQQGVATLMMFPRTEARPPRPGESVPEKLTENLVIASLDKDDFPFKLSDLVGLTGGVGSAALSKAWDIAVAWMQKVGLPSRRLRYQVSFHAGDPYVITSHTTMEIFGFASVGLDADLYSCTGPGGPWKGTVTLSGSAEAILQYAGKLVGAKGATSGSVDFPMNFTLNPGSSQAQHVPFGKDLGLTIALDPDRVDEVEHPQSTNDNWDLLTGNAVVGEGSYLSGGVDLRELGSSAAAGMVRNPEYAVVAAIRDPRCPGSSYWDDRFDDD